LFSIDLYPDVKVDRYIDPYHYNMIRPTNGIYYAEKTQCRVFIPFWAEATADVKQDPLSLLS